MCVVKVYVTRDPCINNNITSNNNNNSSYDDDDDLVRVEVRQTAVRTSRVYIILYKTVCYLLFRVGGPLAALVLLNSRLLSTLRRQKRWRRSRQSVLTSTSRGRAAGAWRGRENVTAMLVTVVTVTMVTASSPW